MATVNGVSSAAEDEGEKASEDHSIICRPIRTGLTGIQMALNSLKNGTSEIRDLLLNECDLIYECKVCRSLHRSLVNFIAHKRSYCQQHCCESMRLFNEHCVEDQHTLVLTPTEPDPDPQQHSQQPQLATTPAPDEEPNAILVDLKVEPQPRVSKENEKLEVVKSSSQMYVPRERRKNRRWHRAGITSDSNSTLSPTGHLPKFYNSCISHLEQRRSLRTETKVVLKAIDSNPNAVYQTVHPSTTTTTAVSSTTTTTATTATPPFKSVFKSSDKKAVCTKCGKRFKSVRKMVVHVQSVHAAQRTYFPCPFCKTLFAQIWSCFRHLMKFHKKSKQQVDKLRERIKSKAFQKTVVETDKSKATVLNNDTKPRLPTPVVALSMIPIVHQCNICMKIFSQKPSLDGHRSSCLTKQRARANAAVQHAPPPVDLNCGGTSGSDRPKRIVKKKLLDENFVNSSYLNIRTNSVNPPKKPEQQTAVVGSSIPANILHKLNAIIDAGKRQCLQCRQTFVTMSNARRHAAAHIGYHRFRCKKCDFQAYGRSQIRCHIVKMHVTEKSRVKDSELDRLIVSLENEVNGDQHDDQPQPPQVKVEPCEVLETNTLNEDSDKDLNETVDAVSNGESHSVIKIELDENVVEDTGDQTDPGNHGEQTDRADQGEQADAELGSSDNQDEEPMIDGSSCEADANVEDESEFALNENSVVVVIADPSTDTSPRQYWNYYSANGGEEGPLSGCGKLEQVINRLNSGEAKSEPILLFDLSDDGDQNFDSMSNYLAAEDHNYFAASAEPDRCLVQMDAELLEAVGSIIE